MSYRSRALGLLLVLPVLFPISASAQSSPTTSEARRRTATRAEALTTQLAQHQRELGTVESVPTLLAQMRRTAEARRSALLDLMPADPAAVIRLSYHADARKDLPAALLDLVEENVSAEGDVEVVLEDYETTSRVRYFLQTRNGRLKLHFANNPPELLTGERVQVDGVLLADEMAVASGGSIHHVTKIAPYTFGEQRTLLLLVNFKDLALEPFTAAAAYNALFNTVNSFYAENSQNQVWLTGDVAGWFTIPMSSNVCDYVTLGSQARSAATAAGINLSQYRRLIYAFPKNACSWLGMGYVGGATTHAWINGRLTVRVLGHELGHNFGLYHAHALECGAATIGSNCSTIEYGNIADIMGSSGVVAHFNAFGKERLGWLNYGYSAPILTITGPGIFSIGPYAAQTMAPKALKILKDVDPATGRKSWYYVEYRSGLGFDRALGNNTYLANGVVIHSGSEMKQDSSFLLDMIPATSGWGDAALPVGATFHDAAAGVKITTLAAGAAGASVSVEMVAAPCVASPPTMALAPGQTQWMAAGGTASWTISVTSNDTENCAAKSYILSGAAPSGWSVVFGSPALVVPPKQTVTTTMQVASAPSQVPGFYDVQVKASGVSGLPAAAVTATASVLAAIDVQVSGVVEGSRKNQAVSLTARVVSNGSSLPGAPTAFTIVRADGSVVTAHATTDASGYARYQVKLRNNEPRGTWEIVAVATVHGVTGTGSTQVIVR